MDSPPSASLRTPTLAGRTASGDPYENHYHFAFRLEDGRIREVREHLDTLYAQQKLFP